MLAAWMLYATAVGFLVVGGMHLLESRWAARGRARWPWLAALLLCLALPLVRPLLSEAVRSLLGAASGDGGPVTLGVPLVSDAFARGPPALAELTAAFAWTWLAVTMALACSALWGSYRLARRRRGWRSARVDGHAVLVSERTGPAVVGVLNPAVVVPSWILGLPEDQRRMILEHEAQHLQARDPLLLATGLAAVAVMPWNPAVWWAFAGLRHAVETDCDHRVLRTGLGRPAAYARLLFDVGARPSMPVPLGAGFGERASSLERRIRTMLKGRDVGRGGGAVRIAGAMALILGACAVEAPDATLPTEVPAEAVVPEATMPAPDVSESGAAPEEFTPYTKAPQLQNRDEVLAALEGEYPPLLRNAGIGGTTRVFLFVDERGRTTDRRLDVSSGHQALDEAALRVSARFRFRPALDGDKPVAVWLSIPITFSVH